MLYCQNIMGLTIAALGTLLVWLPRLGDAPMAGSSVWPAVLATVGFWALGLLLQLLRRK